MATLSPQVAQRTITLMSASKAYNIAGLKTSFMIIQDRHLRERVNQARCGMVDSVNPWAWKPPASLIAKPRPG
jgi:cystathionine beta-lyase